MIAAVLNKINEERTETNIKDIELRKKLEVIMNNTCIQKLENNKYFFYKHFASKKKGIVYQLLLSGDEFDGIYEFKVFGHNVHFKNVVNELGLGTKIDTVSNFDLAEFDVQDIKTIIKREHDLEFKSNVNEFLSKSLNYNVVTFLIGKEKIEVNQNTLGEIKYKKKIKCILKERFSEIEEIICLEKKKKHYVSTIDLGRDEFKKEILDLNLISEEEYNLFTHFNDKIYSEHLNEFKNIEIL